MSVTDIYTLADPNTGEIRYVGKTARKLSDRLGSHLYYAKKSHVYSARWILTLPAPPIIKLVLRVRGDGAQAEQGMIAFYHAKGYRLTNLTDGGEGIVGYKHTPQALKKMSASALGNKVNVGRKHSEEHVAKVAAKLRGRPRTLEVRAKISAGNKGRIMPAEHRARLLAIHLGQTLSPEHRAKIGNAGRGRKLSQEAKNKISVANQGRVRSPEHRAAVAKANKNRIFSPETLAKLSAAGKGRKHSLETRAKISNSHIGISPSPETRIKLSATTRAWYARRRIGGW